MFEQISRSMNMKFRVAQLQSALSERKFAAVKATTEREAHRAKTKKKQKFSFSFVSFNRKSRIIAFEISRNDA